MISSTMISSMEIFWMLPAAPAELRWFAIRLGMLPARWNASPDAG